MNPKLLWAQLKEQFPKEYPFEAMAGMVPQGATYSVLRGELDEDNIHYVHSEMCVFMQNLRDDIIISAAVLPVAHIMAVKMFLEEPQEDIVEVIAAMLVDFINEVITSTRELVNQTDTEN